ncbi:MAG TPA: phosphate ABC transporter permease subunit PstC [Leptolinea sp.]
MIHLVEIMVDLQKKLKRFLRSGDRAWSILLIIAAIFVVVIVLSIFGLLFQDSADARAKFGLNFLIPTLNASWNPVLDKFQSWPFIFGTLVTSVIALVLAVPISLGIAVFLAEICPNWLKQPLNMLVELLASVPSVVYGLWGIFIFLPIVVTPVGNFLGETVNHLPLIGFLFNGPIPESGSSRLAAGLILAIMIIPTIAAVSRDVFQSIPNNQREASYGLGATQWETIWGILFPFGLSGILGACILGLGRALGETMAVTMVIGNSIDGSGSILRPGYTMSSIIANEFAEAVSQLHTQALIEIGLILFVITLLLNIVARLLVWNVGKNLRTQEH